jgi:aminopeptidase N
MKPVLLLLSVLFISQSTLAQQYSGQIPPILRTEHVSTDQKSEHCSHGSLPVSALVNRPTRSAIDRRPYDVLSYKLFMDWRAILADTGISPESRRYSGVNEILIHTDSANTKELDFDAASMRIDSVFSGANKIMTFTQPTSVNRCTVTLPTSLQVGDTTTITIYYTYTGATNRGLFLFQKGMYVGRGPRPAEDSVFVDERLVYTMSEPQDARFWMPCNDAPHDKASSQITVRVPYENSKSALQFTVSSNGSRTIGAPKDDGTGNFYRDFIWQDTTPIPTYLMVVNASKFKEYSQWYKRVTNPNDSVEIINFSWPNDDGNDSITDGSKYNTRNALKNVAMMMEYYSTKFGEYPFVKYGHTSTQPFNYGGMEHQTMTTINRSWLRGFNELGVAHELMHQWTGDLVTCATWNDIWLNEGGATYGEALFYESWGGDQWYQQVMRDKRNGYMNSQPQPPIYGIGIDRIFNYATTYCKAGWVYGMLRKMLGDSVFFPAMQQYFTKHRYQSIETEDMVRTFEELVPNPPVPFRTFFDQWIYSAGHPIYELTTSQYYNGPSMQRVVVNLRQTQTGDDVPEVFVMPVSITFVGTNNETKVVRFINNQRNEQSETFFVPFVVAKVVLDSSNEILCEKVTNVLAVEESEFTGKESSISPNPVSAGAACTFELHADKLQDYTIEIIDLLGRRISTLQQGLLPAGNYAVHVPTTGLASTMYSVRVTTLSGSKDYPFVVVQ